MPIEIEIITKPGWQERPFDYTYVSLGAGVQSSALLACSVLGMHGVPKADIAIFADTQDEPQWVYEYLEMLKGWSAVPIKVVTVGRLSDSINEGFISLPLYTDGGILSRQCTSQYKIKPIHQGVREELGLKKFAHSKSKVRAMIGITIDEVERMKPSRIPWITNAYPLIDAGLDRESCEHLLDDLGLHGAKRSSCVFCPYHGNSYWRDLKNNYPEEWKRALEVDNIVKHKGYLHPSCMRLDEIDFDNDGLSIFFSDCEGVCGV